MKEAGFAPPIPPGLTPAAALARARGVLAAAGIDTPGLDARLLLGAALNLDALALLARDAPLSEAEASAASRLLARRAAREPVDRILGTREFRDLVLALSPDTLSPRADTETLVEAALGLLAGVEAPRLLDLGTGTGAILLALLRARPDATGVGLDLAPGAVRAARANAARHGLGGRASFVAGDWGKALRAGFDLVACNPPYVPSPGLAALAPEVRDHDPRLALDGGPDGLGPLRGLAPDLRRLLVPGGIALIELGRGQAGAGLAILAAAGLAPLGTWRDLAGIERVVGARRAGEVRVGTGA